jgi:predicted dehydrogenase
VKNLGRLGIQAEELAQLTWESPEGFLVSLTLDYLSRPPRRGILALGERGSLQWDGIAGAVRVMLDGEEEREIVSDQSRDKMFQAQAQALLDNLEGRPDPRLPTAAAGIQALAVCDAARRSSVSRREETVRYP